MTRRLAGFAFVVAVALAACAERQPAAVIPDPIVVRVSGGGIVAPDSIAAGWQKLRVLEDSLGHILVFYRVEGADTVPLGGAEVGDSADVTLHFTPGQHLVGCTRRHSDGTRHADSGERRAIVVTAAGNDAEPVASAVATITMHDFAYSGPDHWSAGRHVIRVSNEGQEDHQVRLARLLDDVTIRQWLTDTSGVPLDSTVAGMARIGRGGVAFFEATLQPGRYVIYCLIPTTTGEPHIERGMFREIVVE